MTVKICFTIGRFTFGTLGGSRLNIYLRWFMKDPEYDSSVSSAEFAQLFEIFPIEFADLTYIKSKGRRVTG